jgi:hypothetical protein
MRSLSAAVVKNRCLMSLSVHFALVAVDLVY